ncbi:helix-turn-helix domain-containing protein [Vreelandella alkaliphila]|uniref:helix-turn-helix domain-containing protein n=1 Tax=Vreelandella alkaliphila TaxID=272774 RepID=UPI0039F52A54
MSEERKPYRVEGIAETVRPETLAPFRQWMPPDPGEIRAALQVAGWTGERFAKAIGINARTVRRWLGGDVDIPYAVWAVLCIAAGWGVIWED